MRAVESRVGWRSFAGARDRREVAATRTDGVVVREIGTAQTLLTPAQVDELVARHQGGEGVVALATAYGVHRATVTDRLNSRGARRRIGLAEAEVERAGRLYQRGMTLDEIAVELGTSQRTVGKAVASSRSGPSPGRTSPAGIRGMRRLKNLVAGYFGLARSSTGCCGVVREPIKRPLTTSAMAAHRRRVKPLATTPTPHPVRVTTGPDSVRGQAGVSGAAHHAAPAMVNGAAHRAGQRGRHGDAQSS